MKTAAPEPVYTPQEAAQQLQISVKTLARLIASRGYAFTDFRTRPDSSPPWGPGKKLWRLTASQLAAIVAGQARRTQHQEHPKNPAQTIAGLPGHDGVSRIRRRPRP